MKSVFVIGAGGHGKVAVATLLAAGYRVAGVFDDAAPSEGSSILGCPVLGPLDEKRLRERPSLIAIGSNAVRRDLSRRLGDMATWVTAVHPSSIVHSSVLLGPGTIVMAGAVIQPDALVGRHSIVNTGAGVDHDCVVGDFVHIAPGSHLSGSVHVEEGALLGVGSAVIPGRRVGAWSIVGAGATVVSDVPPRATALGTPARCIEKTGRKETHG